MTTVPEAIATQAALHEQIVSFGVNLGKSPKDRLRQTGHIQGRIQCLDNLYESFVKNDKWIRSSTPEAKRKDPYYDGTLYNQFMDLFFEYKGTLNDLLIQLGATPAPLNTGIQPVPITTSNCASADLKLPHITIPKFIGDYSSWLSFHDMFTSVVDSNTRIPAVQKLHYLKTSLAGDAEKLVRHLNTTSDNYAVAWDLLCTRYNNPKALVNNTLKCLLSQTHIQSEDPTAIRHLLDRNKECLATLQSLKVNTASWDPLLNYLIVERLPRETRQLWEQSQGAATTLPGHATLCEFLETRFRALEALPPVRAVKTNIKPSRDLVLKPHAFHTLRSTCPCCNKNNHQLRNCFKFGKMSDEDKRNFFNSKAICNNCLSEGHSEPKCQSQNACRLCQQRHHTSLHKIYVRVHPPGQVKRELPSSKEEQGSSAERSETCQVKSYFVRKDNKVLLATALVRVLSKTGEPYLVRALLDPGSEASFVNSKLIQRLRLKLASAAVQVFGIGKRMTAESDSVVDITIQPRQGGVFQLQVTAIVLKSVTDFLPTRNFSLSSWKHFDELDLADPTFNARGNIDIVFGVGVYCQIIQPGLMPSISASPVALNTSLGWIVFGEYEASTSDSSPERQSESNTIISYCSQISECDLMRRFWELEEVSVPHQLTSDELLCEKFFQTTHYRTPEGRYVVKLPFAPLDKKDIKFGDSRRTAVKRLQTLKRRLHDDPQLRQEYHNCFDEYLEAGHMERISKTSPAEPDDNLFYLPHHAIQKAESLTTKTRIVFDASAKSSNGHSLNDRLLPGPPLQRDLSLLLFEWRQRKFVFTADIARMYRQVVVDPTDRDYQRILWQRSQDEFQEDYRLTTVTFGVSSAPFLAIRSLHQLAKDEGGKFPLGADILVRDFYVDDLLSGGDTLEEAIEARKQIDELLKCGKFELRKWASNHAEIIADLLDTQRTSSPAILLNKDSVIRTLGLYWTPGTDQFSYVVQPISFPSPVTKRTILSVIARIFDPLGLLSPHILSAKILLQELWQRGLNWDEEVPTDLSTKWMEFLQVLPTVKNVSIPRFLETDPTSVVQIHGFCDASSSAYGAALYLRSKKNGVVTIHLITAKSKVAPLKLITLPRLELCGAVLLSRLIKRFLPSVAQKDALVYAWTDSTIVLSWLRRHPTSFKTFVSNRVAEIISNVGPIPWRHVPTNDNPADYASRGICSIKSFDEKLWWHGPSWLTESSNGWPNEVEAVVPDDTVLELKPVKALLAMDTNQDSFQLLQRYSTLSRLLRITALCKLFIRQCRTKGKSRTFPFITVAQLNEAQAFWMLHEQRKYFADELNRLSRGTPLSSSSKLVGLHPFLEESGLMRVSGRLANTDLPYDERHPIILPPESHFTHLLIKNAHLLCLHGGLTLTLSVLRRNVWIINSRRTVKKFIHQCLPCFKNACKVQEQLMGDLPSTRVKASRPFTKVGVDYAGPFNLRLSHSRGCRTYKGYIAIFVCLCTKAIHIEAVSDLTTHAFLAAFKRFIARRGMCRDVYSDCGTTFVGASNKLEKDLQQVVKQANDQAALIFNNQGIRWHFIPPASPHFGGLWEAGVKSIKHHLKRVAGNVPLSFEEFSTMLAQIEACLNSRPLCPLTDDINDTRVLTPGHFLTGDALLAPPEEDFSNCKINSLGRWNLVQKVKQDFWQAWTGEYLTRLQQRPKWSRVSDNVKLGDLVLIKSENLPSNQWPLGRITQVHPGRDNLIRVVTVKTKTGEFKRPITKICLLPIENAL